MCVAGCSNVGVGCGCGCGVKTDLLALHHEKHKGEQKTGSIKTLSVGWQQGHSQEEESH